MSCRVVECFMRSLRTEQRWGPYLMRLGGGVPVPWSFLNRGTWLRMLLWLRRCARVTGREYSGRPQIMPSTPDLPPPGRVPHLSRSQSVLASLRPSRNSYSMPVRSCGHSSRAGLLRRLRLLPVQFTSRVRLKRWKPLPVLSMSHWRTPAEPDDSCSHSSADREVCLMKLSVNLFMTFDGVSQGPGSPEEDPRDGFTRGGWLMPVFDEGCAAAVHGWFERCGALLLGRRTFDIFAAHWPQVADSGDLVADRINNQRKYVVTSTELGSTWADSSTALGAGFLDDIARLKEAENEQELQVHGSIRLARTLHEAGLIDVYRFLVAPVV